jgi:hypothetical protein
VVVATPFAVDFDYRVPAATIRDRFAAARAAVDREYGGGDGGGAAADGAAAEAEGAEAAAARLPVVAAGHSLGALMHVLLARCARDDVAHQARLA